MLLVRQTSRGRLALRFSYSGRWDWGVRVFEFGEDGVASELGEGWSSYRGRMGALADYLVDAVGLSSEEAAQFAERAEAEWREQGGDRGIAFTREDTKPLVAFMLQAAVAVVVVVAMISFVVWLVSRLI